MGLFENKRNLVEDESIFYSIDESYADSNYDDESINTNSLEDIQNLNHVHPNINARDSILRIPDRIRQAQSEWKGMELLENNI